MKIVLASNNTGKIREFSSLLASFNIQIIPQAELGVTEIAETGLTFIENALIKARHATKCTGLPAIADDSGLAVAALHGAPGIYSARYAGPQTNASDNIKKLLAELATVPDNQRQASFHCVLVYMTHEFDPTPIVCTASWQGVILTEPKGTNGFGYDPVFFDPQQQQCAAEMPSTLKNKISHRGKALKQLLAAMEAI